MRYVFGDCVLDTERYVLHRAGQPIRLRPKVFRLLIYLLTQREHVIPKQELSEQVWNGRFISDATLESTLAALRRALGDHGRDCYYIQTLHGHGYRFVTPVREAPELLSSAAGETGPVVAETIAAWQRDGPPIALDEPLQPLMTTSRNLEHPCATERKLVTVG